MAVYVREINSKMTECPATIPHFFHYSHSLPFSWNNLYVYKRKLVTGWKGEREAEMRD